MAMTHVQSESEAVPVPVSVPAPAVTASFTIRHPPYTYFHLSLQSGSASVLASGTSQPQPQPQQTLDDVAARSYLFAALQQYLGLTGTAVPIDILNVQDRHVWIRVPKDDEVAVTAALSQWVGARGVNLRIEARGSWLGGVLARKADSDAKLWTMQG